MLQFSKLFKSLDARLLMRPIIFFSFALGASGAGLFLAGSGSGCALPLPLLDAEFVRAIVVLEVTDCPASVPVSPSPTSEPVSSMSICDAVSGVAVAVFTTLAPVLSPVPALMRTRKACSNTSSVMTACSLTLTRDFYDRLVDD